MNENSADDESNDGRVIEDLPTLRSQRRFLEIVSLICIAYYWFKIKINTETSLFGQSIHIGSTRYVISALWIGLLWAGVRYGQHLYRGWHDLASDLRGDYQLELTRLANKVVRRYIYRMTDANRRKYFGTESGTAEFIGPANLERFDFQESRRFDTAHKEVEPDLPSGPLGERSHCVVQTTFNWMHQHAGSQIDYALGIGRWRSACLVLTSAVAACVRRPAVLDYVTPALMFIFAVASLLLATFKTPATGIWI